MKFILIKILIALLLMHITTYSQTDTNFCSRANIDKMGDIIAGQKFYPGDQTIDITYYKLNLTISYKPNFLEGIVTVGFKSRIKNLDEFFLDFANNMNVDSVLVNNIKVSYTHNSDFVITRLGKKYDLDDQIYVDFHINGIPDPSGFGSFKFDRFRDIPVIWSLSEPYGAKDWFPCKNSVADKADSSDVWITSDDSFVSVSNGILENVIDNHDGTKTYKWKNRYPIANYLISIAISNYEEYTLEYTYGDNKKMPVQNFVYPQNLTNHRKKQLQKSIKMLEIFAAKFGEYPFVNEKYGHAEFGWSGGMEHQTISSMGSFGTSLMAHELAHQWFGNKITTKNWHHVWLNEGFVTYLESIYIEETEGKDALNESIYGEMLQAKNAEGSIYVKDITSVEEIFDSDRSYAKGAVVLHMLRGILGDSLFFASMKSYATDPDVAYSSATTEDFQKIVEKESGKELSYFFDEWIYGENYPKYKYNWSSKVASKGYELSICVCQSQNSNPIFFTMPIQFNIKTLSGDTLVTLFNSKIEETFTVLLNEKPLEVFLDPGNLILKEAELVPVKLIQQSINDNSYGVEIKWQTEFESGNRGFEIQRFENSKWKTIGYTASRGNSLKPKSYKFFDINPSDRTKMYRINQISISGETNIIYEFDTSSDLGIAESLNLN